MTIHFTQQVLMLNFVCGNINIYYLLPHKHHEFVWFLIRNFIHFDYFLRLQRSLNVKGSVEAEFDELHILIEFFFWVCAWFPFPYVHYRTFSIVYASNDEIVVWYQIEVENFKRLFAGVEEKSFFNISFELNSFLNLFFVFFFFFISNFIKF